MTIIRGESIDDYHAHEALSNSKIGDFIDNGPLWWKRRYRDKAIAGKDSKAFKAGRAFDAMMTEPDTFEKVYVMQPETYPGDKGEPKPWHNGATFCKDFNARIAAQGLVPLSEKEWTALANMRDAVHEHAIARELIALCEPQVTIRTKMPAWGLTLQARPDMLSTKPASISRGRRFSLDFKTIDSLSRVYDHFDPKNPTVGKPIIEHGYHRQAAIDNCLLALEKEYGDTAHYLVFAEKTEPYRVAVVELSEAFLELGWREVERAMGQIAECHRKNTWPGSPAGVVTIDPPGWLASREERLAESAAGAA